MVAVVQRGISIRRTSTLALLLLAFAFVVSAPASAVDRAAHHPLLGQPAPELIERMFTGQSRNFRLSERRGEVVVVGFWTSWCGSCRSYLERLGKLDATYASAGLVVVGVSLDDKPAKAADLTHALGVKFGNVFDSEKVLGRRFQVSDVPLTLLIDRNGVVRYAHGELDSAADAALVVELRKLLDE